jgi:hypothetical protein
MTVAAIDRLVHHATILELNAESYRRRSALATGAKAAGGTGVIVAANCRFPIAAPSRQSQTGQPNCRQPDITIVVAQTRQLTTITPRFNAKFQRLLT